MHKKKRTIADFCDEIHGEFEQKREQIKKYR
jgi:hypothetical protein